MPNEKTPPPDDGRSHGPAWPPAASPTWSPGGGSREGVDSHGKGYLPEPWSPPPRPENSPACPEKP
jgi:hypothetical protein